MSLEAFLLRHMEYSPTEKGKHHVFYFGIFALDFFERHVQAGQTLKKFRRKIAQTACHRRDGRIIWLSS